MASALLAGDGTYSCEIVGEARRQAELRSICGIAESGMPDAYLEQECLALLVPNPADPNDVGVAINGRYVGNLSRSDAAEYHQVLGPMGSFQQAFACRALITAAADEQAGTAYLSVGLDLVWPPRFVGGVEAVDDHQAEDYEEEEPLPRRRRRGYLGTLLAGGIVSLLVVLGLWLFPVENLLRADDPAPPTEATAPAATPETPPPQLAEPAAPAPEPAAAPTQSACPDEATAARAWEIVRNSGLITRVTSSGDIHVNETIWESFPREDRIRFALAGYCGAVPAERPASILVLAGEGEKVLGSIQNGKWLDPAP